MLKLNTHDQTPRTVINKTITFLLVLCAILMYSIYGLGAFACFYYAHSFAGGIFVISIPCVLATIILIQIKDIEKAYVEIKDTEIYLEKNVGAKKNQLRNRYNRRKKQLAIEKNILKNNI